MAEAIGMTAMVEAITAVAEEVEAGKMGKHHMYTQAQCIIRQSSLPARTSALAVLGQTTLAAPLMQANLKLLEAVLAITASVMPTCIKMRMRMRRR